MAGGVIDFSRPSHVHRIVKCGLTHANAMRVSEIDTPLSATLSGQNTVIRVPVRTADRTRLIVTTGSDQRQNRYDADTARLDQGFPALAANHETHG